ncbi:prepilin-type N-terminal cleavage/methylation domain-containing protein [Metabacillus idriensis]|uniref:Prepilin-type N-terminal cleavage/methylation domain-containing protein n=1 Tax=Metabacillus idriensis TaxID=324768 RepID=A0A6I2MF25_9BACI|nr:prepilin-type N-terminal cleavage/methylation domain-containing protein [Metabacillus idriensis]MCM3596401.1 prepilin-type N-terminal cleavage/methylation domain-containing protein [Metabacillus idriensis]MRX56905.1 prepilin-type N-terminal cleavage/methylation domain-containing protein [Metabacillus idriensis]
MLKKMLKNERGLTLIELLAVVVILGIIAAIAVPAIGGVIQKSKEDAALSEASQIIDASKLYVASKNPTSYPVSLVKTSTKNDLAEYLDKPSDFTLTISKNGNQLVYTLTGHKVNSAITDFSTGATEQQIADKLKN